MRVLLILADGMRPDRLEELPEVQKTLKKAAYTMNAQTVMPSVTLPCHMSLFHSVEPTRHGTTTNTYAPQVRPIKGLCEVLHNNNMKSGFFYSWEELRDLSRPGSLNISYYRRGSSACPVGEELTDAAIDYIQKTDTEFVFLYFGEPDSFGHNYGWMGEEYMWSIRYCWKHIDRIIESLPDDFAVIITADHGGHERMHGTDLPEDMTIPLILLGKPFGEGKQLDTATIMDIAPTITDLLGVSADPEWEGTSLL